MDSMLFGVLIVYAFTYWRVLLSSSTCSLGRRRSRRSIGGKRRRPTVYTQRLIELLFFFVSSQAVLLQRYSKVPDPCDFSTHHQHVSLISEGGKAKANGEKEKVNTRRDGTDLTFFSFTQSSNRSGVLHRVLDLRRKIWRLGSRVDECCESRSSV